MTRGLIAPAALLIGAACRSPLAPPSMVTLPVSDISTPAELAPGEALLVTLTVVTGGCRSFERVAVERSAERLALAARGRDSSGPGRACPADIRYESRTYRAVPPFGDPLTVAVRQPDGTELTRVVRVR